MQKSSEQLRKDANTGQALEELRNHYGYKHLLDIFRALYLEAWERLEETEDPVARAEIKAIRNILGKFDDKVNLGADARHQLRSLSDTGS